jgi:hypothetical protein
VTLYTPSGTKLGSVPLGATADLLAGERRVGRVSHRYHDPNNKDNQIDIRLPHSDGAWEIKLAAKPWPPKKEDRKRSESKKEEPGIEIHAWIEQDDHGLSRFEGKTDPFYTLGSISCSDATLTVGAFDTADNACLARPFEATSAGPTRQVPSGEKKQKGKRDKPDLSAPGVRIVAARAQGGVTSLSGTSMAAAHVTGLVALVFQLALRSGKGLLPFSTIRKVLSEGVDPLVSDPFHPDLQVQLGAGRINGMECIKQVLKLEPAPEYAQKESVQQPEQRPGSIAIELHPNPDPSAQRQDTPPPGGQEPSLTSTENSSPRNLEEFNKAMELLRSLNIHSNNGAGNLAILAQLIQQQIDNGKGLRLSVEPLS